MPHPLETQPLEIAPPLIRKLSSIDAFRGWAILLVLLVHISQFITPPSLHLQQVLNQGARGVQLFYVISAFSLMYGYYSRMEKGRFILKDYFLRRLFRIAPLFWIALCFYLWRDGTGPNYFAPNGVGAVQIISTFLFLNGWFPSTISAIIPVGWSVAIEMMFYGILPFVFRYVRNFKKAMIWFTASLVLAWVFGRIAMKLSVLYLPLSWKVIAYTFAWTLALPAQLPVFMTGVLFFFVYRALARLEDDKARETLGMAFMLFSGIIGVSLIRFSIENKVISEYVLFAFIWGLFLTGSLVKPLKIFDNHVTRFFGKISYSAYLWHLALLQFLVPVIVKKGHLDTAHNYEFYLYYLLFTGIIAVVSYASFRLIELPGIHFGEVLIARLKKKSPDSLAAHS